MDGIFRSEKDLYTNKCLHEKYTPGRETNACFFFSVRLDFLILFECFFVDADEFVCSFSFISG